MSLMPMEIESQGLAASWATGDTLVMGLGLGWLAALCALRDEVTRVTVIESDAGLIDFHRRLALFERLPEGAGAKVNIVEGDAFAWRPDGAVDALLIDIWQPLISEGRVAEVQRIQANIGAATVHFWGQELEIARLAVLAARRLDAAGVGKTLAEIPLPLAGRNDPDYPTKVRGAARNWMGDQWLPGTPLPVDLDRLS
jgi:spermidine synthase